MTHRPLTLIIGPPRYIERLVVLARLAISDNRAPIFFPFVEGIAPSIESEIVQGNLESVWRTLPVTADVWLLELTRGRHDELAKFVHRLDALNRSGPRLRRSGPWDAWHQIFQARGMEGLWRDLVDVPPEQLAIPGLMVDPTANVGPSWDGAS